MKRARLACALSLAALACSASGARAGDWWLAPPHPGTQRVGDWYLGASGFGGVLVFPTLNGPTVFTFPTTEPLGVVSTRHKITAAGGGLTFGHVLRDGMLPPWLGARVRIEFEGFYRQGSSRADGGLFVPANNLLNELNLLGTDVTPAAGTFVGQPSTTTMSSRIETATYQLALRLRSDFMVSPSVVLTPSIGVFGGRSVDDYTIGSFIDVPALGGITNMTSTDARIRSWRFGGDLGADLTFGQTPVSPSISAAASA